MGNGSLGDFVPRLSEIIRDYGPAGKGEMCLVICGKSFTDSEQWPSFSNFMSFYGYRWTHVLVAGEPQPQTVDSIVSSHRSLGIALVIAIGGGSAIDTGKAVAAMLCEHGSVVDFLEDIGNRLPSGSTIALIAVPTTAGTGSEATKNAVIGLPGPNGFKKSLRHQGYVPLFAILDPSLLLGCPHFTLATSGLDAITQLIEAHLSNKANALSDSWTRYGLQIGLNAFDRLCWPNEWNDHNSDSAYLPSEAARIKLLGEMLLASYLSGLALAQVGLGTVHGIAGPLGAKAAISHGLVCSKLLSPVLEQGFLLLKTQNPSSIALKKAAWIGRTITADPNLNQDQARAALCETVLAWNTRAQLPRLRSFSLGLSQLDEVAALSDDKQSPWTSTAQQRKAMILEAW